MLLAIEDQAPGFLHPDEAPICSTRKNPERACGRGVFLMRHYMTWVRYNERGNRVRLLQTPRARRSYGRNFETAG